MALPPERVSIKRKRDTEAVDVLLLQDRKRARYLFQKVDDVDKITSHGPKQPALAPTIHSRSNPQPDFSQISSSLEKSKTDNAAKHSKVREFRLNRPLDSGHVHKPGSPRKDLATFRETRSAPRALVEKVVASLKPNPEEFQQQPRTPHKRLRPRASAAEIEWREKQWGSASGSRSASRAPAIHANNEEELKLAELLNEFALEKSRPATPAAPPKDALLTSPSKVKSPLKFQPKPAPPREIRDLGAGSSASLANANADSGKDSESDSDYEYDTYIRVPNEGHAMDVDWSTQDPVLLGKSLGVLVIEDEDEELWATYAINEEDDLEFDTDEEDENAEDYYGNDYPEDELESDDEYDRAAYGYRHAFSDDEQYGDGNDEADWSDVEERPTRLIGSQGTASWTNEFTSPVQHGGQDPY